MTAADVAALWLLASGGVGYVRGSGSTIGAGGAEPRHRKPSITRYAVNDLLNGVRVPQSSFMKTGNFPWFISYENDAKP
jgi:hypothetical protein